MTETQRAEILEVCQHLINAGITYAYRHEKNGLPVYPASRGLKEIEKILERDNA